jgi:A/G-specific adenine glycosylase
LSGSGSPKLQPTEQQLRLRRALLRWYLRGARPLPWRKNPSPYAVWVSEVMLQQTQVAAVIPFYLRFLREFPTLKSLARARLERVLELWSGLGYYRRARHLHAAARMVAQKFHGRVPDDYRLLRSLPGIGDYTARALLSIAYRQPFALMDGNVARVVARLKAFRGNINQPHFRSAVELEARQLLAPKNPGDFNQAMMELGQTVCLPRAPRCPVCPCRKWCEGFLQRRPEAFPEPRPRRATEFHYLAAAIIRRGTKVALVRGLDEGLLMGLWNYPAALGRTRAEAFHNLEAKATGWVAGPLKFGETMGEVRHIITHRAIHVDLYPLTFDGPISKSTLKWLTAARLGQSAISQLARKISAKLSQCLLPIRPHT